MHETEMTCPLQTGNAEVVLDYCSQGLEDERKAMWERHRKDCASCREMAAVWSALDLYTAEPISEDFDRKLYRRIGGVERVSFWTQLRSYLQWKPALPVAVAALAVAAVFFLRSDIESPETAVDQQAVEQVERVLEDMDMLRQLEAVDRNGEKKELL